MCSNPFASLKQLQAALEKATKEELLATDVVGRVPLHLFAENDRFMKRRAEDAQTFTLKLFEAEPMAMTFEDDNGSLPFVGIVYQWVEKTYIEAIANNNQSPAGSSSFLSFSSFPHFSSHGEGNESHTANDTTIENLAKKSFPYVEATAQVELALSILSVILDRTNTVFPQTASRTELYSLQDTIIDNPANIPFLLKTILLIEQIPVRDRILRLCILQRVMMRPHAIYRDWLCRILRRGGYASKRAVDYLERVSKITLNDHIGSGRDPRQEDAFKFVTERYALFDKLGELPDLIPSLMVLKIHETDRASTTDSIWDVLNDRVSKPVVLGNLAIDFAFHIILYVCILI